MGVDPGCHQHVHLAFIMTFTKQPIVGVPRITGTEPQSWTNLGLQGLSNPHRSPGLHLLEPG